MTVAEMIAELQKLPPDAKVVIEGYLKGSEDCNGLLYPEMVEGIVNEEHGVRAVIWASIAEDHEEIKEPDDDYADRAAWQANR